MLPCEQAHIVAGIPAPGWHGAPAPSLPGPAWSAGPVAPRAGMERRSGRSPGRHGAPVRSLLSRLMRPAGAARGRVTARRGGTMSDGDLMFRGAVELAAMVRSGEVSARELTELSLQRIEE